MSYPAELDAKKDPLFRARPSLVIVFWALQGRLDFVESRRLRAETLARELELRPETVGACLKILRDAGYVERGERVLDVFTYRLVYSRPQREVAPEHKVG